MLYRETNGLFEDDINVEEVLKKLLEFNEAFVLRTRITTMCERYQGNES